jgi:hypothetical protein
VRKERIRRGRRGGQAKAAARPSNDTTLPGKYAGPLRRRVVRRHQPSIRAQGSDQLHQHAQHGRQLSIAVRHLHRAFDDPNIEAAYVTFASAPRQGRAITMKPVSPSRFQFRLPGPAFHTGPDMKSSPHGLLAVVARAAASTVVAQDLQARVARVLKRRR